MRLKIFVTLAALLVALCPALAAEQTAMTAKQISDIRAGINNLKTTLFLKHQNEWCKKEVRGTDEAVVECAAKYAELIGKFSKLEANLGKFSWERFVSERNALVPLVDEVELKFDPQRPKQAAAK